MASKYQACHVINGSETRQSRHVVKHGEVINQRSMKASMSGEGEAAKNLWRKAAIAPYRENISSVKRNARIERQLANISRRPSAAKKSAYEAQIRRGEGEEMAA